MHADVQVFSNEVYGNDDDDDDDAHDATVLLTT